MPALIPTTHVARAVWIGIVPDRDASLRAAAGEALALGWGGPEGEAHGGVTRPSCSRVAALHPRGTEIANVRQPSIVSREELDEIAREMGLHVARPRAAGRDAGDRGDPGPVPRAAVQPAAGAGRRDAGSRHGEPPLPSGGTRNRQRGARRGRSVQGRGAGAPGRHGLGGAPGADRARRHAAPTRPRPAGLAAPRGGAGEGLTGPARRIRSGSGRPPEGPWRSRRVPSARSSSWHGFPSEGRAARPVARRRRPGAAPVPHPSRIPMWPKCGRQSGSVRQNPRIADIERAAIRISSGSAMRHQSPSEWPPGAGIRMSSSCPVDASDAQDAAAATAIGNGSEEMPSLWALAIGAATIAVAVSSSTSGRITPPASGMPGRTVRRLQARPIEAAARTAMREPSGTAAPAAFAPAVGCRSAMRLRSAESGCAVRGVRLGRRLRHRRIAGPQFGRAPGVSSPAAVPHEPSIAVLAPLITGACRARRGCGCGPRGSISPRREARHDRGATHGRPFEMGEHPAPQGAPGRGALQALLQARQGDHRRRQDGRPRSREEPAPAPRGQGGQVGARSRRT